MTRFALGVHNHQPVGNLASVLEEAYQRCYRPFLEVAERFGWLRLNFHISGSLFEWLESNHPEYIRKVASLVAAGRLEVLGSGFYEPILSLIPERDRRGQVARYLDRLQEVLGVRPTGLWLAERVWEQQLVSTLSTLGIRYVVLDDYHFLRSGLSNDELGGYYATEDCGEELAVFPISRRLRYAIPFGSVRDAVAAVVDTSPDQAVFKCLFDDGEKLGLWPGTHDRVYGGKWLAEFLECLGSGQDRVTTVLLSEVLSSQSPLGTVYLDNSSYEELDRWALQEAARQEYDRARSLLREHGCVSERFGGGHFRNFLVKHQEANRLHKRMCWASNKVARMGSTDPSRAEAQDQLYRGQCNDAYWHGLFGGLHLPHLRQAVYRHLARASRLAGASSFRGSADFDADGNQEIVVDDEDNFLVVLPARGATLWVWERKGLDCNIFDFLAQGDESDESEEVPRAADGGGLDGPHGRSPAGGRRTAQRAGSSGLSGLDHVLSAATEPGDFLQGRMEEVADIRSVAREVEMVDGYAVFSAPAGGLLRHHRKKLWWGAGFLRFEVDAELGVSRPFRIGIEFDICTEFRMQPEVVVLDEQLVVELLGRDSLGTLEFRALGTTPFDVWCCPCITRTRSERGTEEVFQGTRVLLSRLAGPGYGDLGVEVRWRSAGGGAAS